MKTLTREQVKRNFGVSGISVSGWAKEHGFGRHLVHSVLSGRLKARIGKSHKIAVLLGLKKGKISDGITVPHQAR